MKYEATGKVLVVGETKSYGNNGYEKREVVVGYEVGDSVKITDGALVNCLGTVEEIDLEHGKVRVVVSMFGRETPVELELDQIEAANN